MIELDVEAGRLHLEVRTRSWRGAGRRGSRRRRAMTSGYQKMYIDHVHAGIQGADLDFLRGCRGAAIPRESH